MQNLYLLTDEHLSNATNLERHLKDATGNRYTIERVPSVDSLQDYLRGSMQGVVFFSAAPEKLAPFIQQCRSVQPATAFVSVIDDADIPKLQVMQTDCHFLRRSGDTFEILNQLSGAVRQAELLATIAGSGQLDEITNLYNRGYFLQRLGEEISMSKRHLSPLCCVVIGINMYQIYVDSYGYDFINALIRFLADKITSSIRHEDIVARISDDEIAILLPRSTEKGAKVFTNRLLQELNETVFRFARYEEEISVCAGLIGYPLPDQTEADADTLIRYGRHALHQARCNPSENTCLQLFSEIKPAL
ncbi:MAG TPA: GGDEF domain-containing protein [Coleofasciculaceae cyanobacterium]|jgi:diguanylate cyclase (GGDEF)-like protein